VKNRKRRKFSEWGSVKRAISQPVEVALAFRNFDERSQWVMNDDSYMQQQTEKEREYKVKSYIKKSNRERRERVTWIQSSCSQNKRPPSLMSV